MGRAHITTYGQNSNKTTHPHSGREPHPFASSTAGVGSLGLVSELAASIVFPHKTPYAGDAYEFVRLSCREDDTRRQGLSKGKIQERLAER